MSGAGYEKIPNNAPPPPYQYTQPAYQPYQQGQQVSYPQVPEQQSGYNTVTNVRTAEVCVQEDNRDCCSHLGNLLWIICGNWISALIWLCYGIVLCVTIVGIPCGLQCFKMAKLTLFPFGQEFRRSYGSCCEAGCGSLCCNILWLPFGIIIFINHVVFAALCFISIIGIPFGIQHLKIGMLGLCPFGTDTSAYRHEHYSQTTVTTYRV
eukprot:Nk52_evm48s252 gene=Nk52_evmTU48s252